MYFNQESFIFHPLKINKETKYTYPNSFKEIDLKTSDDTTINNLYFETENPKGAVYFLHGNAGNLSTWVNVAPLYLESGYNVLLQITEVLEKAKELLPIKHNYFRMRN